LLVPAIGLPFLFFYGSMWCVMAYVVGYLVLVRMRRERQVVLRSTGVAPDDKSMAASRA
jgi:hypothetical protein